MRGERNTFDDELIWIISEELTACDHLASLICVLIKNEHLRCIKLHWPVEGGQVEGVFCNRFFIFLFIGVIEELGKNKIRSQFPESHVNLVSLFRSDRLVVFMIAFYLQMRLRHFIFILKQRRNDQWLNGIVLREIHVRNREFHKAALEDEGLLIGLLNREFLRAAEVQKGKNLFILGRNIVVRDPFGGLEQFEADVLLESFDQIRADLIIHFIIEVLFIQA